MNERRQLEEQVRLQAAASGTMPWKTWGPYLSERRWGTVREDYSYLPAESDSGLFGGNSNWRGPIWFPMNYMLICGLIPHYAYYGDGFTVECRTGSGQQMTLWQVSQEIAGRLVRIFLRDEEGRRPVCGDLTRFQEDPHWRDHLLFHEYFHGDNGAGLVASHQTGWTGLMARLIPVYYSAMNFEADFGSTIIHGHPSAL